MPLSRVNVHSTQCSTKSISNLGAKIWNLFPVHTKDLKTLSTFKNLIKKWIPKYCPCRLCKVYVAQVGYLQKLLRLFASFSGIQYCLFYSVSSCFILFYFIYFFIRFLILIMLFMYFLFLCMYLFIL